jgi:tRNA (guanine-N7-)-methyltransferase
MPHIYVKEFKLDRLKDGAKFDEVQFLKSGTSLKNPDNLTIFTKFREKEFFLQIKNRDGKSLVKSEKNSRPSPNFPVHKSIATLSKELKLEILSSNLNEKESLHISKTQFLKEINFFRDFSKFIGNVEIEIGFGSGRHLLHKAENDKDTTFIGIEIHKPSIEQALKQIELKSLKNLYILDFDARHLLEIIPSNRISKIYVHFPVPWDKKPHRRVIQKSFLKEAKRVLEVGGILELRTDSENYFQSALKLFLSEERLELNLKKNISIEVTSKYETRWLKMEKNIYNLQVVNLESSIDNEKYSIEKTIFREREDLEFIEKLLNEKVLKDDWFISFRDIYKTRENEYIIHYIGGSYSYPESIFLLLTRNKIEYLIEKPLELRVNIEIDKYLRELL